ncbi:hypothetical protein MIND_00059600 [Mycena indigotica]|uniref:Uncharacterized protein n=1 Tax=Mycena indigotica TaxID=2126181 RepID=A0A8H6TEX4_9AGAR|nr:uncharacterized protein MIND_00059600 [Mycena indigotica]KAF7315447.1 hypothetical protein MIND_00059600 [Mycena indigotica]
MNQYIQPNDGTRQDATTSMESEMSHHQRNLVDLCFEEGEYDAGIELLSQLKSSTHRPSKSHIRQLLYIALLSSSDREARVDPSASPSKRQRKLVELPSLAASRAAQMLLMSFVSINNPRGLMLALQPGDVDSDEEPEGFLATESLCISCCKHCWQILVDGFLLDQHIISSKGKGRMHSTLSFNDPTKTPSPVGETAWPILEWFVSIFERDQQTSTNNPSYSPLLLEQLGTPSRRDSDAALATCHYCFAQADPQRRLLGVRLLNLLLNLASATDLDFPLIVLSIFNGLSGKSPEDIASLLASLKPSPAVFKFKIAFYQKYFNDATSTSRPTARPRPQARAQQKGTQALTREASQLVNKYRAPSSGDLLRLMQTPTTAPDDDALRIKFDLLVSYHEFQTQASPAERDAEWSEVVRNGTLLDETFGCRANINGVGLLYRDMLETILSVN